MLVLKSTSDSSTKVSDCCHVGRQAVHLILHLFEIILHLSYSVWGGDERYEYLGGCPFDKKGSTVT